MQHLKTACPARALKRSIAMLFAVVILSAPATANEIDLSKYMRSASTLSALASALAAVDDCSVPIQIAEEELDGKLRLMFHCQGSEDDEAASGVEFDVYGEDLIIPSRFLFAG